jgi:hypothetical protein
MEWITCMFFDTALLTLIMFSAMNTFEETDGAGIVGTSTECTLRVKIHAIMECNFIQKELALRTPNVHGICLIFLVSYSCYCA